MSRIEISVVIPCKDRKHQLCRAISSVAAQSALPAEVIVVDDGSDPPLSVGGNCPVPVRIIRQPNRGPSAARNRGIAEASGQWIALLDSDDTWLPEKLGCQSSLLRSFPQAGFCACYRHTVGWAEMPFLLRPPEGVSDGPVPDALAQLVEDCCVPTSGAMFRKDVFQTIGGFDEQLWYGEDWDLWLRLAAATPVLVTTRRLIQYHRESDSIFDSVARGERTVWLEKDMYILTKLLRNKAVPQAIKRRAAARLQQAATNLAYFYRRSGSPVKCIRAALWSLKAGAPARPALRSLLYAVPQSALSRRRRPEFDGGSRRLPQSERIYRQIFSRNAALLTRQELAS